MRKAAWALAMLLLAASACGEEPRVPPPDFETDYKIPALELERQSEGAREVVDVFALLTAMGLAAWLLHWKRSRAGVFCVAAASLAYFGFYKQGCVCSVGSLQNVALAVADSGYAVPLTALAMFLLPIIFALVFGRVFCGAACPLGIIQDMFLFRPVAVPRWLEGSLRPVRFVVLGIAVFFAATAGRFVICEFDPFVGLFRRSGQAWLLFAGGGFLLLGMFVGRPVCRYLCPYGALLSLAARWPSVGVSVTPDECIKCTLCDEACPFGAIERPAGDYVAPRRTRIILWSSAGGSVAALGSACYLAAGSHAGTALGVYLGIVVGARLVSLGRAPERKEYGVTNAECLSCGRCYRKCPRELKRLKALEGPAPPLPAREEVGVG